MSYSKLTLPHSKHFVVRALEETRSCATPQSGEVRLALPLAKAVTFAQLADLDERGLHGQRALGSQQCKDSQDS